MGWGWVGLLLWGDRGGLGLGLLDCSWGLSLHSLGVSDDLKARESLVLDDNTFATI